MSTSVTTFQGSRLRRNSSGEPKTMNAARASFADSETIELVG